MFQRAPHRGRHIAVQKLQSFAMAKRRGRARLEGIINHVQVAFLFLVLSSVLSLHRTALPVMLSCARVACRAGDKLPHTPYACGAFEGETSREIMGIAACKRQASIIITDSTAMCRARPMLGLPRFYGQPCETIQDSMKVTDVFCPFHSGESLFDVSDS